jgi:large subunit ribosomal protein L23
MAIFGRKKTEDNDKKSSQKGGAKNDAKKTNNTQTTAVSMKDLYEGDKTSVREEKKVQTKRKQSKAYRVLVKPLITEKATHQVVENKYVFAIDCKTNKIEIAKAIEDVYGIKPIAVNIVNVLGKKVRYGRTMGKRKDWKKAIVTLPKGKIINIYEGV